MISLTRKILVTASKPDTKNNANAYQIKVLGNFGSDQTGGEFYASFNAGTTVTYVSYDAEYPLILSWDFNVLPFSACLIGQLTG